MNNGDTRPVYDKYNVKDGKYLFLNNSKQKGCVCCTVTNDTVDFGFAKVYHLDIAESARFLSID